jgi:hypothetical protein
MFASHTISRPKAADEFRLVFIGDSGVWGWLLENEQTLAGHINQGNYETANGRRVIAYNLGYPILALSKDLLILEEALVHEPDMIVWLVTLDSFPRHKQLQPPMVQNNQARMESLINRYNLALNPGDEGFVRPDFWEQTIVGQRRPLADLLRLQLYGFSWMATGIDQAVPDEITLRQSDFSEDINWQTFTEPAPLTDVELAFDLLAAGIELAGDVPVIVVNEPIFISVGENNHLRYNAFYPRWAYDAYRQLLADKSDKHHWQYLDLWDSIPSEEFTDTPVHLTARGEDLLAELLIVQVLLTKR